MKYFPLVWAALRRKPFESVLICLAVTAAFTLFGLMLGLHAMYHRIADGSRMDRIIVNPRFPGAYGLRLPLAMQEQIARIPGVAAVGAYTRVRGYYQHPHNTGGVMAVDETMRVAWSELQITAAQWSELFANPNGVLVSQTMAQKWQLKSGDVLPLITPPGQRADGGTTWEFHVLAVVPDTPTRSGGFILGNFKYVDGLRPLQNQGYAIEFRPALLDPNQANDISLKIDRLFANSGFPTISIPEKADMEDAISSGIAAASVTWPVAGAGIFMILMLTANGITQSVRDRQAEFAVLKTLGYRTHTLNALVFAEAAIPCLVGAVVGSALAATLTHLPTQYLPSDLADGPRPTLPPLALLWAVVFAAALAFASAAIPIFRLGRMSVTDALAGR